MVHGWTIMRRLLLLGRWRLLLLRRLRLWLLLRRHDHSLGGGTRNTDRRLRNWCRHNRSRRWRMTSY